MYVEEDNQQRTLRKEMCDVERTVVRYKRKKNRKKDRKKKEKKKNNN